MDFQMREALRKSRIFLLENVVFEPLCDHMIAQDIFSSSMLDNIKAKEETTERIRRTIDHLSKRPNSCFWKFLDALNNSGHEHCATHVKENYVRSGPTQVSGAYPNQSVPGQLFTPAPVQYPAPAASSVHLTPANSSVSAQAGSLGALTSGCTSMNWTSGESSSSSDKQPQYFGFPEVSDISMGESASANVAPLPLSTPIQESFASQQGVTPGTVLPPQQRQADVCISIARMSIAGGGVNPQDQSLYQRCYQSDPTKVYRMESNPRGMALVISNENFENMNDRQGSHQDMQSLHEMFKLLGFDISHEMNKTAAEMKQLMRLFAQHKGLRNVDSLALVIMSHGGRDGVIYGKDGRSAGIRNNDHTFITDEVIMDIFNARNCPLMADKPKVIIIQACRGRGEDSAPLSSSTSALSSCSNQPITVDGGSTASGSSSTSSTRCAKMSNMLFIHSTVHGFVSYRHPLRGSPFVNMLTDFFRKKATTEHVVDIMTEVTSALSEMQLQHNLRTLPSTTTLLTKKWYLNPQHLH